jgi:hypothetical protein
MSKVEDVVKRLPIRGGFTEMLVDPAALLAVLEDMRARLEALEAVAE